MTVIQESDKRYLALFNTLITREGDLVYILLSQLSSLINYNNQQSRNNSLFVAFYYWPIIENYYK